jgi:hypothetical protein
MMMTIYKLTGGYGEEGFAKEGRKNVMPNIR